MATSKIRRDFYDVDLNFKPTLSKDVGTLRGNDAVSAGVSNYIFVNPREKLYNHSWGLGIKRFLFELDKDEVHGQIKSKLEKLLPQDDDRIAGVFYKQLDSDPKTIYADVFYIRSDIQTSDQFTLNIPIIKGSTGL